MLTVRGHNEGTIFQRRKGPQKGSWVSAVTMRDGRRVSRTTHSRDDARAALVELIRLRDAGATMTGRIRLGDYLLRWVSNEHGWAPATLRKHESAVRVHLAPALGHIRLSELSPADVEGLLVRTLRGLGPRSLAHLRATLRRALADASRDGLVSRNAAGLARPIRLPHRERTVLDANQARLLIESTRGTRYGPLWTILVTTGLRISEALGLAWSDVDLGVGTTPSGGNDGQAVAAVGETGAAGVRGVGDGGREGAPSRDALHERGVRAGERVGAVRGPSFTVRHQLAREAGQWVRRQPKTAKGRRTIPLTPLGVEALRAQREQQRQDRGMPATDGLVFTTEAGHPIHATNLLPKLRADLAAAGLPKVGLHDLRHSCATLLFAQGVPMPVISDILGHSTTRITEDLYRHRVPALSVEAARLMQEALG